MTTAKHRPIGAGSPDPALIEAAADTIRRGGVVVCPTSGLYGLAADPFRPAAVQRVFEIKGRPEQMPLLVLIDHPKILKRLITTIPAEAQQLMDRYWPGSLTVVMPAQPDLPPALTGGSATLGVRLSALPVARALAKAAGGAITGTSANRSGQPGCSRIPDLDSKVAEDVDLILDAGPLAGGPGSTVVDCTQSPPVILRAGAIPTEDLGL